MRCEVVAIGTELLLGQITDTNSSWIGEQLAHAGIDSHHQVKVGDNLHRIVECIEHALKRSDAVITCGGLGPTQDDITREAIARVMGAELERDETIAVHIRRMFANRGRSMPANNLRQADVPVGASAIPEMPGTAPGLICPVGKKVIYAVPGVPSEMRAMLQATVLPDLQRRAGISAVIQSRVLRTWGHSESGLAELVHDRLMELEQSGTATLAFQASGIEGIKVRITAKANDAETAAAILDDEEHMLRELLGPCVFGRDEQTMESVILELLRERHLSLAAAETVTGGFISTRLSAIAGAETVLRGSVVLPTPEQYKPLLDVSPAAVPNPETTAELALAVREKFHAEVGIASTGVVREAPVAELRPGTVFLAVTRGEGTTTERIRLPGDRVRVREFSVIGLLNLLRLLLQGDLQNSRPSF